MDPSHGFYDQSKSELLENANSAMQEPNLLAKPTLTYMVWWQ